MPDYGRSVQFGLFPTPDADRVPEILQLCEMADAEGLDFIGIQDHPYQKRFLDAWSLMAVVLARTQRVRVFPDVASLPLRPPAMLAKAAASLDILSGGRLELGLGAGAFWPAIGGMGGPERAPGEAAGALIEAIDVIRLVWSGERSVSYDGSAYRLSGMHPGPPPAHDIGVWLGVGGPRMLAVLGRSANGWIPSSSFFPPAKLPDMHARIDESAREAGREPADIQRVYNVFGEITDGASNGFLNGPTDQWVDDLTRLVVETGMDTFVFGAENDDPAQHRRWAAEVAPAVAEAVARERG
ncbi:LLM class flavin-dependent oxidoreductase [Antrihabitans sp. YC2-6]|uniref:LLM class flavin-dependent oxidoreductase n=1 Tax=Antrihabitans sp. YC2-6 TaxID=2799498 RepID=UPI0018F603F7|nr:LLM class flavin-dependent oxidoreductase [Antrihabitans sp. YC2-6]MBJ8346063.1 LLM class flavin-dependent oxidoreductase [Antrihabitans sp. YC2-6]